MSSYRPDVVHRYAVSAGGDPADLVPVGYEPVSLYDRLNDEIHMSDVPPGIDAAEWMAFELEADGEL